MFAITNNRLELKALFFTSTAESHKTTITWSRFGFKKKQPQTLKRKHRTSKLRSNMQNVRMNQFGMINYNKSRRNYKKGTIGK